MLGPPPRAHRPTPSSTSAARPTSSRRCWPRRRLRRRAARDDEAHPPRRRRAHRFRGPDGLGNLVRSPVGARTRRCGVRRSGRGVGVRHPPPTGDRDQGGLSGPGRPRQARARQAQGRQPRHAPAAAGSRRRTAWGRRDAMVTVRALSPGGESRATTTNCPPVAAAVIRSARSSSNASDPLGLGAQPDLTTGDTTTLWVHPRTHPARAARRAVCPATTTRAAPPTTRCTARWTCGTCGSTWRATRSGPALESHRANRSADGARTTSTPTSPASPCCWTPGRPSGFRGGGRPGRVTAGHGRGRRSLVPPGHVVRNGRAHAVRHVRSAPRARAARPARRTRSWLSRSAALSGVR